MPIAADLTDPAFPRAQVIEQAEAALGPVDILVNNAAMSVFRNVIEWTPAKVRLMWEVNVLAPWELVTAVVPGMVERGRGWIVNISSGVGEPTNARPGGAAYGGTKAMLDQMTRCLALELDGTRVTANVVSPAGGGTHRVREPTRRAGRDAARDHRAARGDGRGDPRARDRACRRCAGIVMRDLDLLDRLGRPVRTLDGTAVLAGYDVADLPQRIAELADAAPRQQDLRGAWGQVDQLIWGTDRQP